MPEIFNTPRPDKASPMVPEFEGLKTDISFQKQEPDEQILLILRKHFVTNFSWIFTGIVLFFLPFLMNAVFSSIEPFILFIPARFYPIFLSLYYISIVLYMLTKLFTWFYDVFIITQKRIVDIDFSDVIYHDVAITKVEEVEDVHYNQGGFLSSLFNFGNLFIQTQGNKANFEAYNIPNPSHAAHIIVSLTGKGGKDD